MDQSISLGATFDVSTVVSRLIVLTGLVISLVLVGRGIAWGLAGVAFYAVMQAFGFYANSSAATEPAVAYWSFIGFFLGYALLAVCDHHCIDSVD